MIAFNNNRCSVERLQNYINFIENTDLQKYFEECLNFQGIKNSDNVMITCISKVEVDFLKQNFETIVVSKDDYFDDSVQIDYKSNSLTKFFIENTYNS